MKTSEVSFPRGEGRGRGERGLSGRGESTRGESYSLAVATKIEIEYGLYG